MMKKWNKPAVFAGVAALAAAALAAALTLSPEEGRATVYLAHLSPDAPAVDIYVNNTLVEPNLSFTQVGGQRRGPSGRLEVAVRLANTSQAAAPLITAEIDTQPGGTYVVGVMNVVERLQVASFRVQNENLLSTDARLEVLHAIPEGPRINVRTGENIAVVTEHGWVEDMRFIDLVGGDYRLIGSTAVTAPEVPGVLFDETYNLQPGAVYTLIVAGPPVRTIMLPLTVTGDPLPAPAPAEQAAP